LDTSSGCFGGMQASRTRLICDHREVANPHTPKQHPLAGTNHPHVILLKSCQSVPFGYQRPADDLKLQERLYVVNKKYCISRRKKQTPLFYNGK